MARIAADPQPQSQAQSSTPLGAHRVLILSAAVGGGHNAAEGLREELINSAPEAHVTLCNGLGAREGVLRMLLERSTRWQLTHCPAVYSTLYRWAFAGGLAAG